MVWLRYASVVEKKFDDYVEPFPQNTGV